MNILVIHQNFVDHQHPGGTRHLELARHWVRAGHQVTIVAGSVDYLTGRPIERSAELGDGPCAGVRVRRAYTLPTLHRSFAWRAASFASFMVTSIGVACRAGRTDIVLGTSPPIFQLLSAWLVASSRRCPLVLEIRDLWPAFAIEMGILRNRLLIHLAQRMERFFYARATHLVVNSPAYRTYLLDQGVSSGKITVIPNGVDADMFAGETDGDRLRRELGLQDHFVVTYAGALGQANDIPTILRAARRLRADGQIHFLLVGDGKERESLARLARAWDLRNVTFAGAFPKQRMAEVLAASDACVATLQDLPMFRTTYPNKVFDYMAAARPTLLGIDGVIREVLEDAQGGLYFPPGNDEALASAIVRLRNDPAAALRLGQNSREYVAARFDRGVHAARFEQLLGCLVDRRPVPELDEELVPTLR